jgi:hypothetical protein
MHVVKSRRRPLMPADGLFVVVVCKGVTLIGYMMSNEAATRMIGAPNSERTWST